MQAAAVTRILKFYSSQQLYKVPTPCRLSVVPSDGRHRCLGNDCKKKTRKYHICSIKYEKTENNFANPYFSRHIEERKKKYSILNIRASRLTIFEMPRSIYLPGNRYIPERIKSH